MVKRIAKDIPGRTPAPCNNENYDEISREFQFSRKKRITYEKLLQKRKCHQYINTPKFGGGSSAFKVSLGKFIKHYLEMRGISLSQSSALNNSLNKTIYRETDKVD